MNPNTQQENPINPPASPEVTPIVTESQPTPEPTPELPQQPLKKSRKKLVIGILSGILLLIIGGIVATALTLSSLTSQAKDAASTYNAAVKTHIATLTNAESVKARLDSYPNKPTLKTVTLGESLSKEYKDAKDLQTRYNALLDGSYQTLSERFTTIDIAPFFKELAAKLSEAPTTSDLRIKDDASIASAKQYIADIRTKADSYNALAKRFEAYTFAEKYRTDQAGAVEALKNMAKSWNDLADLTDTQVGTSIKILEAEKAGNFEEVSRLISEESESKLSEKSETIRTNYSTYGQSLVEHNKSLVGAIIDDDYINIMLDKSQILLDELKAFEKTLK